MQQQNTVPSGMKTSPEEEEWPSLFEETHEMLKVSMMMYFLATLRDVARKYLQENEDSSFTRKFGAILELPINLKEIVDALDDESVEAEEDCALYGTERINRANINRHILNSLLLRGDLLPCEDCDDHDDSEDHDDENIDASERKIDLIRRRAKSLLKGTFSNKSSTNNINIKVTCDDSKCKGNERLDGGMGTRGGNEPEFDSTSLRSNFHQKTMRLFDSIYGPEEHGDPTLTDQSTSPDERKASRTREKEHGVLRKRLSELCTVFDDLVQSHGKDNNMEENNWEVVEFDDENSEREILYGIVVDHFRKEVIVAFRGTVTFNDWIFNCQNVTGAIPNPVPEELFKDEEQSSGLRKRKKSVSIHLGFRRYLECKTMPSMEKHEENNQDYDNPFHPSLVGSKFLQIYYKTRTILEKYPQYRLYTTGHSLGGSLSKIAALHFASDINIKQKPVSCVAFASPKIGTLSTRLSFEALEKSGNLRCLQISNEDDVIPEFPQNPLNVMLFTLPIPFCSKMFDQQIAFRDTGINLFLHRKTANYTILYPKVGTNYSTQLWDDWHYLYRSGVKFWEGTFHCVRREIVCSCRQKYQNKATYRECHGVTEYLFRIRRARAKLEQDSLNEIYEEIADHEAPCLKCCSTKLYGRPRKGKEEAHTISTQKMKDGDAIYYDENGIIIHYY